MGAFFTGWRRKFGVAMLLMSCAFMAAWASRNEWLSLSYPSFDNQHYHRSITQMLRYSTRRPKASNQMGPSGVSGPLKPCGVGPFTSCLSTV